MNKQLFRVTLNIGKVYSPESDEKIVPETPVSISLTILSTSREQAEQEAIGLMPYWCEASVAQESP